MKRTASSARQTLPRGGPTGGGGFGIRRRSRFHHLLALLLAALFGPACQEQVVIEPAPIRPVRFTEVFPAGGARTRVFSGAARAGVESRISFKVAGTIQELEPRVGDLIRTGSLIAKIDPRDYELQVEEAEAQLAQTRAQALNAEAEFKRIRALFERNNASQGDYDAARAARDSAQAQGRAVQKKLEGTKLQLSYTTLRSPLDGAVAQVPVEVNENVSAGQPVVILTSGALPEVEIPIPEVLIRDIRQGAAVEVTFDAIPNRRFSGRVTEVAPAATQGLTTYPVTVRLSQPDKRILPGMAAEVAFRFGTEDETVRYVVPPHAVEADREGRFVYVVEGEMGGIGTVQRRSVVVGELVGQGLEILEGLREGDLVVTAGASAMQDGQQVRLLEEHRG